MMAQAWAFEPAQDDRVTPERAAARIAHLLRSGDGYSRDQMAQRLGMHIDDVMAGVLRLDARGLMLYSSGLNRWFLRDVERLEAMQ